MQQSAARRGEGVEFRLTVWLASGSGWHARVVAPDTTEHEFASPFELARYLAWPHAVPASDHGTGLR